MIRRREFITLLGGAALTCPMAARAQQSEQQRRIGVLINLAPDDPEGRARLTAFAQALEQLGWSDGHNLRIDTRWARANDIHKHAAELALLAPDILLAANGTRDRGTLAAGDSHFADRICERHRPGRRWFCRELGAAGR